jgi:gamma-glutamyltranspeptidase/glutathione hydrolase
MIKILFLLFLSCSHVRTIKVGLLDGHTQKQHESFSPNFAVATQGKLSSLAGIKMIELGGNAFDAAAAISFAIAVERPQSTGLGGGGFMVIDGPTLKEPKSLDFRETAPIGANKNTFLDKDGNYREKSSVNGSLASGVPGMVKGVLEMHQKYGVLSRKQVLQPAIEMAKNGIEVYPHLHDAIKVRLSVISKYPASKKIFTRNSEPLKIGEILVQDDLALTLQKISDQGAKAFYQGDIANKITREFKSRGGLIKLSDLNSYQAIWRRPVSAEYKGYKIYSMGPPSSGGIHLLQILKIIEDFQLDQKNILSANNIHQITSAMQLAFIDRAKYLGDPDFVKVPIDQLLSPSYLSKLRKLIKDEALKIESDHQQNFESSDTTHFTVMDKEGNVITSTQTINGLLGSGLVVPGTGIVLNNQMDDFTTKIGTQNIFGAVGGAKNIVEPAKRPLSSMSPTVIKKGNKTILALGSPSGTRILTCVAQVILNYIEFKLPLYDSVASLRYHHQWRPDLIRFDLPGVADSTYKSLITKGHVLENKDLGCKIQAIARENDLLHSVSDPRGEGLAIGI